MKNNSILSFKNINMVEYETLQDIRNLDIFLGDDAKDIHTDNIEAGGYIDAEIKRKGRAAMNQVSEDNRATLSDALNWNYSLRVDKETGRVMYSTRDHKIAPIIDRTKKEVSFQTIEGIKEVFTYDIDDMQEVA